MELDREMEEKINVIHMKYRRYRLGDDIPEDRIRLTVDNLKMDDKLYLCRKNSTYVKDVGTQTDEDMEPEQKIYYDEMPMGHQRLFPQRTECNICGRRILAQWFDRHMKINHPRLPVQRVEPTIVEADSTFLIEQ